MGLIYMEDNLEILENTEAESKRKGAPCCVNRELSWLKFNERVLEEAKDARNPLCERLTFASIFQSNLDEFFMVRVGMLYDKLKSNIREDKTNMTCREQLDAVVARTGELLAERDKICRSLFKELRGYGINICSFGSLSDKSKIYLENYFKSDILPLLSPQIISRKQPFPFLQNKGIYAIVSLKSKNDDCMGIIPCGEGMLRRLVPVPGEASRYIPVEEVILQFASKVFDRYRVESRTLIRIVRNADLDMDDDSESDYRKSMEKLIRRRKRLCPVKMEYTGKLDGKELSALCSYLNMPKKQAFAVDSYLDLSFVDFIRDELRDKKELFYPYRFPQQSVNVDPKEPMADQIRRRDILLAYPYESVRPFLNLLSEAGQDPEVVSIKMTLYRVARNSKVIEALADAAQNGKEVVVLVELRARFDEENNIGWSRVLEEAGCRVIYGLEGYKVHSKLMLITRRHENRIEYITQIGTGNYNENTVKAYTDYSLMTASQEIGQEAANFFNCLSMGQTVEETNCLMVAPHCLRSRIMDMIDGEIEEARSGNPAYVGVKLNGLTDRGLIDKFIEASQAGVKIDLIVRGICCIIGGVPGYTDNIRVISIVGRYLEHARIYIFGVGERRRLYISSADFMTRNTMYRVEVAVPIYDEAIKARLEHMFTVQLMDNVKAREQQPDGTYKYVVNDLPALEAQEQFFDEATNGAWKAGDVTTPSAESAAAPEPEPAEASKPEPTAAPEPELTSAPSREPAPAPEPEKSTEREEKVENVTGEPVSITQQVTTVGYAVADTVKRGFSILKAVFGKK